MACEGRGNKVKAWREEVKQSDNRVPTWSPPVSCHSASEQSRAGRGEVWWGEEGLLGGGGVVAQHQMLTQNLGELLVPLTL